jgi:hypothetical protein
LTGVTFRRFCAIIPALRSLGAFGQRKEIHVLRSALLSAFLLLGVLAAATAALAAAPDVDWVKEYGDSGRNVSLWIEECSTSGYVVSGMWAGAGPDDFNALLMRIDTDGDTLWTRTWGDTLDDAAFCVRETSDGGFILAGYTERVAGNRDAWFIRTDADGDTLWTSLFDFGDLDILYCVEQMPGGDFIACGYSTGAPPQDSLDVLVMRIDANGDGMWKLLSEIPGNDRAIEFCKTSDGNVATGGFVAASGDQGDILIVKIHAVSGDTLWTRTYYDSTDTIASGIREAPDGGLVVCGGIMNHVEGWGKAFLLKTDDYGDSTWMKEFGGPGDHQYASSVVVTPDLGYAIGARRDTVGDGNYDCYYMKLDSSGDTLWTREVDMANRQALTCMTMTSDFGYISCAEGRTLPSLDRTIILQKLSEDDAGVVSVEKIAPPDLLAVDGANPFTGDVPVRYEIPSAGPVKLTVYDVAGRQVAVLADAVRSAGSHSVVWDLRNAGGSLVPSGVYFIRCAAAGRSGVEKVIVLR